MVVAHPDDETLWGGAHLMTHDWFVVCLTNGDNEARAAEFRSVLKHSGNSGVIYDYPDLTNGEKDDWTSCEQEITKDLARILDYEDWKTIATHNPEGETGHIHHLLTHRIMRKLCEEKGLADRLYYFGRFYNAGEVPPGLPRLPEGALSFKKICVSLYEREAAPIQRYWAQMIPFENWVRY